MKHGVFQCLTYVCMVDLGFEGAFIKSCKKYFIESFHTKALGLVQLDACSPADRGAWLIKSCEGKE